MTTLANAEEPTNWQMELRRIIASLEANEADVCETFERLQLIYLEEFEPNETPNRSVIDECFYGSFREFRDGYYSYLNNPVKEFVLWGEHIMSKIEGARKFFESREMKELMPLWQARYEEAILNYITTARKHRDWRYKLRKVLRQVQERQVWPWEAACEVRLIFDEFARVEIEADRLKPYHASIIKARWEDYSNGLYASKSLRRWAEPFVGWRGAAKFFACELFWRVVEAIELEEAR